MCRRLVDKVAVVTGAAGYLGRFHCIHLAREGARVVATDTVSGQATVDAVREDGGEAIFIELDVTNWEQAQRAAEEVVGRFGRIDVLVNNAGLTGPGIRKPWIEFTSDDWDRKLAADVKGCYLCARAVFPTMKAQRDGKIINISSQVVLLGTRDFLTHVSAKAAVVGLTRALATEVGDFDINVNAIIVGAFPQPAWQSVETMEQRMQRYTAMQTFKRAADPNDLSRVVVFLASDESRWITGQAIAVCGGTVRGGG